MAGVKVRYKGRTVSLMLTHGKEYTVLSIERNWYRIIDDSGEMCIRDRPSATTFTMGTTYESSKL